MGREMLCVEKMVNNLRMIFDNCAMTKRLKWWWMMKRAPPY